MINPRHWRLAAWAGLLGLSLTAGADELNSYYEELRETLLSYEKH